MSAWCSFKISRISQADEGPIHEAKMHAALLDLRSIGSWDRLQICPDAEAGPDGHWQFPRISAGWEPDGGGGYVVQCYEDSDSLSFFLSTSAVLSDPEVCVELGGAGHELWPPQLFVPYELALRAMLHFLATGLQDPALAWVGIGNFTRKAITCYGGR